MEILNAAMTRQAEENAVGMGMDWLRLMENAGSAVAAAIKKRTDVKNKKICAVCGSGGNGGDGFVAVRKLYESGAQVVCVMTSGSPKTSNSLENYRRAADMGIKLLDYTAESAHCLDVLRGSDIIIDAIFGIGFHGDPIGNEAAVIDYINGLDKPVISVDIPSGVSCDDGAVNGKCIRAALTVTFNTLKPCHVFYPAADMCCKTVCASIGMPSGALEGLGIGLSVIESNDVSAVCRPRRGNAHKGSFGSPLLVCGSFGMAGAAAMATMAALRSGAGVVCAAVPKSIYPILASNIYEAVYLPLEQTDDGRISAFAYPEINDRMKESTAVLVGPGLGCGDDVRRITENIIKNAECPLIIDADGINALSGRIELIRDAKAPVVLTPHPGEMARLMGTTVAEIERDRVSSARIAAAKTGAVIVLKGAGTIVASPDGETCINITGNPGMATGGSGDVLAGMIAAFSARGFSAMTAAKAGVYYHGAAGDKAAVDLGETAMLPTNIIERLPFVFK